MWLDIFVLFTNMEVMRKCKQRYHWTHVHWQQNLGQASKTHCYGKTIRIMVLHVLFSWSIKSCHSKYALGSTGSTLFPEPLITKTTSSNSTWTTVEAVERFSHCTSMALVEVQCSQPVGHKQSQNTTRHPKVVAPDSFIGWNLKPWVGIFVVEAPFKYRPKQKSKFDWIKVLGSSKNQRNIFARLQLRPGKPLG